MLAVRLFYYPQKNKKCLSVYACIWAIKADMFELNCQYQNVFGLGVNEFQHNNIMLSPKPKELKIRALEPSNGTFCNWPFKS